MDDRLYTLFYRRGLKGATTGLIQAPNQELAEFLGQQFCGQDIGRKYIRVEPAVVACTDDLPEAMLAELTKPKAPVEPKAGKDSKVA